MKNELQAFFCVLCVHSSVFSVLKSLGMPWAVSNDVK